MEDPFQVRVGFHNTLYSILRNNTTLMDVVTRQKLVPKVSVVRLDTVVMSRSG